MSDPVVPEVETPKKGLSTGAKVAIGCLLGVVLVLGGCFVVSAFLLKKGAEKVQEFGKELEENPDAALVRMTEMTMRANPEVEVVSSDPEGGTITIRSKRDGKEVTLNVEDIRAGKLSVESGGETIDFDLDTEGDGAGTLTVDSADGHAVFGASDADSVPEWVPIYPGARTDGHSILEADGETSGSFTLHTADAAESVLGFYADHLGAAGFEVRTTTSTGEGTPGNVNANQGNRSVNVTVLSQEGETQGLVAFSEKP